MLPSAGSDASRNLLDLSPGAQDRAGRQSRTDPGLIEFLAASLEIK